MTPLYMISFLAKTSLKPLCTNTHFGFVLHKLFKKHQQPRPQTVSKPQEQQSGGQQISEYDFMGRKEQIEMSVDYRALKQKYSMQLPSSLGAGGFDEVIFWSQQAKTLDAIQQVIRVFNQFKKPQRINDYQHFNNFKKSVVSTINFAATLQIVLDYALFGFKYDIEERDFWTKVQKKALQKNPSNDQEYDHLVNIAFLMSKHNHGNGIYNFVRQLFKGRTFTPQQNVKLIMAYHSIENTDKQWIVHLLTSLQKVMSNLDAEMLGEVLIALQQTKVQPQGFQMAVEQRALELVSVLELRQICTISHYYGFCDRKELFSKLEARLLQIMQKERLNAKKLQDLIIFALSSYNYSQELIKNHILPLIIRPSQTKQPYQWLFPVFSIKGLSSLSKVVYIYELEKDFQVAQYRIQEELVKRMSSQKDLSNWEIVEVVRDYSVTRQGQRSFYLFLEQLIVHRFQQLSEDRTALLALITVYRQSNLCSIELLNKLESTQ